MVPERWKLKENNFKCISKVQNLYLQERALTNGNQDLISKFDNTNSNIFKDYGFLLLAMNGNHGLYLHIRKFYFNALSNSFEPIYHDGDLNLTKRISRNYLDRFNLNNFEKDYKFEYYDQKNKKEF